MKDNEGMALDMGVLSMLTSPLVSKFLGTIGDKYHDYRQGKGHEMRKKKKAQRRREKQGRRNSHG